MTVQNLGGGGQVAPTAPHPAPASLIHINVPTSYNISHRKGYTGKTSTKDLVTDKIVKKTSRNRPANSQAKSRISEAEYQVDRGSGSRINRSHGTLWRVTSRTERVMSRTERATSQTERVTSERAETIDTQWVKGGTAIRRLVPCDVTTGGQLAPPSSPEWAPRSLSSSVKPKQKPSVKPAVVCWYKRRVHSEVLQEGRCVSLIRMFSV